MEIYHQAGGYMGAIKKHLSEDAVEVGTGTYLPLLDAGFPYGW